MKTFKKTFEIIDYVRLFHEKMSEFYGQLREQTEKQRIKMLLDYLCQHERHREETLEEYKKGASSKVLNNWFKYVPENIPFDCFENIAINPDMSVDDVVDNALSLNNCLIEMYKGLIEVTKVEEVKEMFCSLLKRIEKEEKNLVRDAAMLNCL
jgi:rubrerythrin